MFGVPAFDRASQTRFFLCVRATDPRFDREGVRRVLAETRPLGVWEVPL
ncbi:MAG: hypothetical protein C0501_30990 [Isosphaera sp.]|nr:hypothetical protein [Isosphaera sp.]